MPYCAIPQAMLLFNVADTNGDGSISRDEMMKYVRSHQGQLRRLGVGEHFSFKKFWASMLSFDWNEDGRMQLAEFVEWYIFGREQNSEVSAIMAAQDRNATREADTLHPFIRSRKEFIEMNVVPAV